MSEHEHNSQKPQSHTTETSSRRRFLRKGAIAAPIITSLASRPVWARGNGTTVGSISGNLSGNLSNNTTRVHEPTEYGSCSPGYWHNPKHYPRDWDGIEICFNTPFNTVFIDSELDDGFTTVIHGLGGDDVERRAAATFMNSISDPNIPGISGFPYKPYEIIDFYHAYLKGDIKYDDAMRILKKLEHTYADGDDFCPNVPKVDESDECDDDDVDDITRQHPHGRGGNGGGGKGGGGKGGG